MSGRVLDYTAVRRTFLDPELESRFRRDGYVTCALLDERRVAEASKVYDDLKCDLTTGWHADLLSTDLAYRRKVYEHVSGFVQSMVLRMLDRYRYVHGIFVVKEPAVEASRVPIHQDWTVVDDDRFCSINVFCPLVDTTAENGWLVVVPGSHHPPTRVSFGPSDVLKFAGDWNAMTQYMRPLALKAGEAVLYHGRLLHGSPSNRTPQRRVAVSAGFVPEEATLRLQLKDPSRPEELEILDLPEDFFLTYLRGERPPNAVSRGFVPHRNEPLTEEHLRTWTNAAGIE